MQGYQIISLAFSDAVIAAFELESVAGDTQGKINSILSSMNPPSDLNISNYIYQIKALANNFTIDAGLTKSSILSIREYVCNTDTYIAEDINREIAKDIAEFLALKNQSLKDSLFSDLNEDQQKAVKEQLLALLYNSNQQYGGDQGAPLEDYKNGNTEYAKILRKFFPKITNEEITDYLTGLQQNGCGYVAAANYIFEGYIDRPKQYLKDFGFPMFYMGDDGKILSSINYLTLDVYCYANKEKIPSDNNRLEKTIDKIKHHGELGYAYRGSSNYGSGLYASEEITIVESDRYANANINGKMIKEHTVESGHDKFQDYTSQIEESLNKGNVVELNALDYTLYYTLNDEKYPGVEPIATIGGSHAMTITDVNDSGEFIVSTWGGKFILDSSTVDNGFGLKEMDFNKD